MYTSDDSLISDNRLTISDNEVMFTVSKEDETEIYSMPTSDYAESLQIQSIVQSVVDSTSKA